ncbi:MAG: hypothetical protein ACI9F9_001169 [Candidatus Paceibacteria bacterium]
MITGNPALLRLATLKFRGALRRQLRKLKSPSGAFFATVGVLLTIGWVASLVLGRRVFDASAPDPATIRPWTQLGIGVFTFLSVTSAIAVRGIYLPKQDIERLFAAPIQRGDLVRYRMLVDMGRSIFGALVLGLLTFQRMPEPSFGLLGATVTILTLGIVRQAFSLLLGGAKTGVSRFLKSRSVTFVRILVGVSVWLLIVAAVMGGDVVSKILGGLDLTQKGQSLLDLEPVRLLLCPFYPWASMMSAQTGLEFLGWLGLCLSLGLVMFELTARLPVDFREMSLETSEHIAKRMNQVRRGGLFTGGKVSKRTTTWRLPRLFGSGPMGAVAWVKWVSIVRKARGTLLLGVAIVTFICVLVTYLLGDVGGTQDERTVLLGSGMIGLFGITYLGGALRFDFRSDLDRMVQVKAWPVSPIKVFVGTLLPEVFLISGLLGLAILIRMLYLDALHAAVVAFALLLPCLSFAWLAVDNIVFLFAPVRFVPGQEGSLHHTGRAIVLFLLRLLMIAIVSALVSFTAIILFSLGPAELGLTEEQAAWISGAAGLGVLLGLNVFLAWAGGKMLRRFDVARDRG